MGERIRGTASPFAGLARLLVTAARRRREFSGDSSDLPRGEGDRTLLHPNFAPRSENGAAALATTRAAASDDDDSNQTRT